MLSLLKIKNLALVDELRWEIQGGLISVTGETGAGKSVIVGALKLVLGDRADKNLIRTGEENCEIEAMFELPNSPIINSILQESGFDSCEENQLIIKRIIGQSSNKQFINNSPATLSLLKNIGDHLVDLHGPHDHQSLLSAERQLSMLDAYAGAEEAQRKYKILWRQWREKQKELHDFISSENLGEREMELLRHQLEEIESAKLSAKEEEELLAKHRRVANSTRLIEQISTATSLLSGTEEPLLEMLTRLKKSCRELEKLDPELTPVFEGVDNAVLEIEELDSALHRYLEGLDTDPSELTRLEARINTLETLKRKYGPLLQDVISHGQALSQKISSAQNHEHFLQKIKSELEESRKSLDAQLNHLSKLRKAAAPKLAKQITTHLKELGFEQASLEIRFIEHAEPEATGAEAIEFEFGPNPGEPLKPLRQIASSGEISRVMLSVKSTLAKQDATPLMVFDEIDANVGGKVAAAVGQKMASLGKLHQVIAITHFPQVAAAAQNHFVVSKEVKNGRTSSKLKAVQGQARVHELVRMLGGGTGKEVYAMAKSLLSQV